MYHVIDDFHGTYGCPSTTETLKIIKQKHDESLLDYMKHFCNARNATPYIQDIEVINAFCDGVSDIKTVEEIAMKKPKMVADLLAVADVCIEADLHGKKIEREISLAQHIELDRRMKWSEIDISFGPEDHPMIELSNWNLAFMVKLLIGRHKVAKTLINNEASLNVIMRKTFIEMGLSLGELTLVHDTFHGVILGQLSSPIGHIDLEVSCGSGDNKRREMLMFEVTSFNIGYNCILGRHFLLKFTAVIHIAYATIKMPNPKGDITIKANQQDALA
jgi:hypothetical protein